jgi:predicted Zn-dependent protease
LGRIGLFLLLGTALAGVLSIDRAFRDRPTPAIRFPVPREMVLSPRRQGFVAVAPVGPVDPDVLSAVAFYVGRTTGFRVEIMPDVIHPRPTDLLACGSLNGGGILELLSDRLVLRAVRFLGVTERTMAYGRVPSCLGLGQPEGKVALVSVREIGLLRDEEALTDPQAAEMRFQRRLFQIVLHELGHTFRPIGLMHCPRAGCLMHPVDGIDDLDRLTPLFCRACRTAMVRVLSGSFNNHVTYYNIGCYFAERKLWARAEEAYRLSLARCFDFAPAYNNLGVVLLKLERPVEAEKAFRRATSIDPGHVAAGLNLSQALVKLSRPREAARNYESWVRQGVAPAALHLGRLCRDVWGNPTAAQRHFRTFFRLGGVNEDARRWLARQEKTRPK